MCDSLNDPDEVQCDFCGEWIDEELAEEAGWINHYFVGDTLIDASVCFDCKRLNLQYGEDNKYQRQE